MIWEIWKARRCGVLWKNGLTRLCEEHHKSSPFRGGFTKKSGCRIKVSKLDLERNQISGWRTLEGGEAHVKEKKRVGFSGVSLGGGQGYESLKGGGRGRYESEWRQPNEFGIKREGKNDQAHRKTEKPGERTENLHLFRKDQGHGIASRNASSRREGLKPRKERPLEGRKRN